jgi:hypothetical protein
MFDYFKGHYKVEGAIREWQMETGSPQIGGVRQRIRECREADGLVRDVDPSDAARRLGQMRRPIPRAAAGVKNALPAGISASERVTRDMLIP